MMLFHEVQQVFQHIIIEAYYNMVKFLDMNLNKAVVFYTLTVFIIIVETMAIGFLKRSLTEPFWTIFGVAGYSVVALMFREVLKFAPMGKANALWDCGAIILVSIVGIVFYGDKYTHVEYLGLFFAILSTFCMVWKQIKPMVSDLL